jgi:hypothetical protein
MSTGHTRIGRWLRTPRTWERVIPGAAVHVGATRTEQVRAWRANVWVRFLGGPLMRVALAILLLVAAGGAVYAVVGYEAPPDKWCHDHEVGCGFGVHLTGTLVAGLLAYLFFYRLVTEPRVLFPVLRNGLVSPAKLFRWLGDGSEFENPIGRKEFVRELVRDARSRSPGDAARAQTPHVIVGDGGSGKTTVLVAVAAELTRRGMIPVPLTLRELHHRDATELDFAELAKRAFVTQALAGRRGGRAPSTESIEKTWRILRPRMALLVDDLEKVQRGQEGLRAAFAAARSEGLMLIAASRLDGLPPGLEASVVELEALSESKAVKRILECGRASRNPDHGATPDEVGDLVTCADVTSTPYFMRLAMRLASEGRLPRDFPPTRAGARLSLLEAYHEVLRLGGGRGGDGLISSDRDGALEDLERLACQSLGRRPPVVGAERPRVDKAKPTRDDHTQYWPAREPFDPVPEIIRIRNRDRLADAGERMGVIYARRANDLRFTHQVLQAYFASRLLREPSAAGLRAELLERNPASPYLAMALVLAAAGPPRPTDASGRPTDASGCPVEVCAALLRSAREHGRRGDAADRTPVLNLITAAVEAAALAGPDAGSLAVDAAALSSAEAGRRSTARASRATAWGEAASVRLKHQLFRELSALGGEASVKALWAFHEDPDYSTRWHAILGITATDACRFAVVDAIATDAIATVRAVPAHAEPIDDNPPDEYGSALSSLKPIAWMLPALHSDAVREERRTCAERLEAHMQEIHRASRRSDQHGILASLAQGFKVDAVRHADRPSMYEPPIVPELLFWLLRETPFWYTKVTLLHAISLNVIAARSDQAGAGVPTEPPRSSDRETTFLGRPLSAPSAERRLRWYLETRVHPFVRAAGELCLEALDAAERGGSWREYIWTDDEVEVIARPPLLHAKALHLVADMALLLNLNEQKRSAHERARFGQQHDLPACLRGDRTLILEERLPAGKCPAACPFVRETDFSPLCPDKLPRWEADDATGESLHSRRLLNRSFCRRLRHTASHQSWTAVGGERLGYLERRAHVRQLRAFWEKMERRSSI